MERHLEKYGDWVVSEFGEDGRRSRLITWYVFDPDKFRRHQPGWCGTSITEYRNVMPSHVTLLDAAGLDGGVFDSRRWVSRSFPVRTRTRPSGHPEKFCSYTLSASHRSKSCPASRTITQRGGLAPD